MHTGLSSDASSDRNFNLKLPMSFALRVPTALHFQELPLGGSRGDARLLSPAGSSPKVLIDLPWAMVMPQCMLFVKAFVAG